MAASAQTLAATPAATLADGARFYEQGDYARALSAWRALADKGNAEAQNNLGLLYLDGKGVAPNLAEAVRHFQLSAAAGLPLGQNNLGGLYRDGRGLPPSAELPARLPGARFCIRGRFRHDRPETASNIPP